MRDEIDLLKEIRKSVKFKNINLQKCIFFRTYFGVFQKYLYIRPLSLYSLLDGNTNNHNAMCIRNVISQNVGEITRKNRFTSILQGTK